MSNFVINPYNIPLISYCYTTNVSETDNGMGYDDEGDYRRFGGGQRILTGSSTVGETLTTASFYLRKASGRTPTGTLTCAVLPSNGTGGTASGIVIGTYNLASLPTSYGKINFSGTNTRVIAPNDCIMLYMPENTWNGYEIEIQSDAEGTQANQDMCFLEWLSSSERVYFYTAHDADWCFNKP